MLAKKLQNALGWLKVVPPREKVSTLRIEAARGKWILSADALIRAEYIIEAETKEPFVVSVDRRSISAFLNSLSGGTEVQLTVDPFRLRAGNRKLELASIEDSTARQRIESIGDLVEFQELRKYFGLIQAYAATPDVPHLHILKNTGGSAIVTNRLSALRLPGIVSEISIPVTAFEKLSEQAEMKSSSNGITIRESLAENEFGTVFFPALEGYNDFPKDVLERSFKAKPNRVLRFRASKLLQELNGFLALKPEDSSVTLTGEVGNKFVQLTGGHEGVRFEASFPLLRPLKKEVQEKVLSTALVNFLKFDSSQAVELSFKPDTPYYWELPDLGLCLLTARKK